MTFNISHQIEQHQRVQADLLAIDAQVDQDTDTYYLGFWDGKDNGLPEDPHDQNYWEGYCEGLKQYWVTSLILNHRFRTSFIPHEMNLTALRHLSRIMTAITIPRQPDLTVNFFPRMSFGTTYLRSKMLIQITNTPYYVWNFTDTTPVSNPFPSFQGANSIKLTANYARFLDTKLLYNPWNAYYTKVCEFLNKCLFSTFSIAKFDSSPPKFPFFKFRRRILSHDVKAKTF